jgi:hypothetical protein
MATITITISGNCSIGKCEIAKGISKAMVDMGFGTIINKDWSNDHSYDGLLEDERVEIKIIDSGE